MALQTMYPAKNNSPATALTEGITAESTSMTLYDASVLPDAPNICVIGNDDTAEIVSYTGISGNTVTGLGRGINGTIKKVWSADTYVARNITAYDHEAFRANILDLDNRKTDSGHTHDDRYYTETEMDTTLALKAPLASPALTGTPTAPTAAAETSTTQIATTAFATTADHMTRDQIVTIVDQLRGKKVSIIGDSISTYTRYLPTGYKSRYPSGSVQDVDQTWWKQMLDFAGATLEVNASWSGSRTTDNGEGTYPDFYARCNSTVLGSPDVVIVAMGTNDSTFSVDIGDYDYTTTYTSLSETTFATAYIKGIKALQATFPNAVIICSSLYMKANYATVIKNIATTLGCAYVYAGDYQRENGVHPGAVGMKEIALSIMTSKQLYADGSDTGWQEITNAGVFTGTVYYRAIGQMVNVVAYSISLKEAWTTGAYKTLSSNAFSSLKPITSVLAIGGNRNKYLAASIGSSNGTLYIYKNQNDTWGTDESFSFCFTYFTA